MSSTSRISRPKATVGDVSTGTGSSSPFQIQSGTSASTDSARCSISSNSARA